MALLFAAVEGQGHVAAVDDVAAFRTPAAGQES